MPDPLITADALARRLGDPALRIADTRAYLGDPEGGRRAYEREHLPGAVFVDLERHLSAHGGPGRHPLPPPSAFAATMGRLGIGDEHMVVAYDDRGGAIAARLWWMLRELGHEAVVVLDGGLQAWRAAGYPVTSEEPLLRPAGLSVGPPLTRQIERASLLSRLGSLVLVDARAPERYRGEEDPVDPVAGHIPTARNLPYEENLRPDGRMLSPDDLASRFEAFTGDIVVYCGSGVTACHTILAAAVAGLGEPMLYPGSWSDWGASGLPVAVGPDPGPVPPSAAYDRDRSPGT
jgi:thiosulfate/3-mercaptopyruvate sulfurtransferase